MNTCIGVVVTALMVGVVNYLLGYRGEDDGVEGG